MTSRLSEMEVETNLNHFHPFGLPVYVLENKLQDQQYHNKWSDRSRVGIFMCHSHHHSSSVPLVLNTQSGNVSPQFHCIYDDYFNTCHRSSGFNFLWQGLAKLQTILKAEKHILMYFILLLPPRVGLSFRKSMARCRASLFRGILKIRLKRTLQHLYQTMMRKLLNHLFLSNNFFLPMLQKTILSSQLVMAVVSVVPLSLGMLTPIQRFRTPSLLTNGTMTKFFASFKTTNALLNLISFLSLTNPLCPWRSHQTQIL